MQSIDLMKTSLYKIHVMFSSNMAMKLKYSRGEILLSNQPCCHGQHIPFIYSLRKLPSRIFNRIVYYSVIQKNITIMPFHKHKVLAMSEVSGLGCK